jgi:hypothetical protein
MFASLLNDAVAGLLGTRFATAPADVVVDNVREPTQQPKLRRQSSVTLTRCPTLQSMVCLSRLWMRLKTPAVWLRHKHTRRYKLLSVALPASAWPRRHETGAHCSFAPVAPTSLTRG